MAQPFADQFDLSSPELTNTPQATAEAGTDLATNNLQNLNTPQRESSFMPSSSSAGVAEQQNIEEDDQEQLAKSDWNAWNLVKSVNQNGERQVVQKPKTLQEKKAVSLAELQEKKRLRLLGLDEPEDAEARRVFEYSQSPLAKIEAIGNANAGAEFDTQSVTGMAGNLLLRAGKSFTDIIDEDIIGANQINNIDQQTSAQTREMENQSLRTVERLSEANADYEAGNHLAAASKAMGAIVDMGSIMGRSLWNNPTEVLDMLADSAAFFVGGVGAAGRTFGAVRDVSYALRAAKQGILDYEETHGVTPTGDALGRILIAAGASGILSSASAEILQGRGGMLLKRPANAIMDASANAAKAASQRLLSSVAGRKIADMGINATRIGAGVARDAVFEAGQEIAQEYLESNVMQDKDLDGNDIQRLVEAGVAGGIMGGAVTAPRTAIELAKTSAATVQNTSALEVQDAKVRKLLKQSNNKVAGKTPEQRQALYSEALREQAIADEQASKVEAEQALLQESLDLLQNSDAIVTDNTAERESYAALTAEIADIQKQIKTEQNLESPQITIKGLGKVSLAEAQSTLASLEAKLENTPEPAAELTPAQLRQREIIQALTPAQREREITAIKGAMGKNNNSLKSYARTKQAAEAISKRFKLTDAARSQAEAAAAAEVKQKAEAAKVAKEQAAAAARGDTTEARGSEPFDPTTTTLGKAASTRSKKPNESKTQTPPPDGTVDADIDVGADEYSKRPAGQEPDSWDARTDSENMREAVIRLMNEYTALSESGAKIEELAKVYAAMEAMTDMNNADVARAYSTVEEGKDAVELANAVAMHLVSGKAGKFITPSALQYILDKTPDDQKASVARGVYNSIAKGPEEQLYNFMLESTPERLEVFADARGITGEAKAHFLAQGAIVRGIAEYAKNVKTVNVEILDTGFDGAGDTGERPSVLQHSNAIQEALESSKDGEPNYKAALEAFVKFDEWARNHVERRQAWIKLLKNKGHADREAQKESMSAADKKLFPYAADPDFYDTLVKEDELFRAALVAGYQALGPERDGITEWWLDGIATNRGDSKLVREANKTTANKSYNMADQFADPTGSDGTPIDQTKLTAGQKENVRKKLNLLKYFGSIKGMNKDTGVTTNKFFNTFQRVNNLIARVISGDVDISQVDRIEGLGDGNRLSKPQADSWKQFLGFSTEFSVAWKKIVRAGVDNKHMISSFFGDNGKEMDNNIISMLSAVAYDYVATQGKTTLSTDMDGMNKMFGTERAKIPVADRYAMLRALNGKGIPRAAMVRELGLAAMANIGIKFKHPDAPSNLELQLASELGLAMMDSMIDQGIMKVSTVDMSKHKGFKPYVKTKKLTLVSIESAKGKGALHRASDRIAEYARLYKKDGNILKLLGGEYSSEKEVFTVSNPPPKHTRTAGGENKLSTNVNGVDGTKEKVEKMNAIPRKYKEHWRNLVSAFGMDMMKELDGFNESVGLLNIDEQLSVQGSNNQIEDNITDFVDHVGYVLGDNWLVNHTIVSNQRINIEGHGDYQKNKWVRMAMENVENSRDVIELDNADHTDKLFSSFSSYMGGTDAQRTDSTGKKHRTLATVTPEMRKLAVLEAMAFLDGNGTFALMDKAAKDGKLTLAEQKELTQKLKDFQATYDTEPGAELVELVNGLLEYRLALKSGKPSFESSFSGEADGVSNGVFFTLVQMGLFKTYREAAEQLNRYGLKIKDFTGTSEDIAKDIYEYIGAERQKARKDALIVPDDATENDVARIALMEQAQYAMDFFIGAADARSTNKPHTMTTIYSMGIAGQFEEIAKLLQSKVTAELSRIAQLPTSEERTAAMGIVVDNINAILDAESTRPREKALKAHQIFSMPGLAQDVTKWTDATFRSIALNTKVAAKLDSYAKVTEGPHLQAALETVFGKFGERSAALNSRANTIFTLAQMARKNLVKVELQKALDAGDITETEFKEGFLPQSYEQRIDQQLLDSNMASRMPSAQSTKGEYDTYMPLGSTDIVSNSSKSRVGLRPNGDMSAVSSLDRIPEGPGSGAGAVSTQALDGEGMTARMAEGVLGVHDAIVAPALRLAEQSQMYNKHYASKLVEYSHIDEATQQLLSMLDGMLRMSTEANTLSDGPDTNEMHEVYRAVLKAAYPAQVGVIADLSYERALVAVNDYKLKLEKEIANNKEFRTTLFDSVESIDQMGITGTGTAYEMPNPVSLHDLADPAPLDFVELNFLPTDTQVDKETSMGEPVISAILQQALEHQLADAQRMIDLADPKTEADRIDLGALENLRQWLVDLKSDLGQALSVRNMVKELHKNPEYSIAEQVNKVLMDAFEKGNVLLPQKMVQAQLDHIRMVTEAVHRGDIDSAERTEFMDLMGSPEYVASVLYTRAMEIDAELTNAREEREVLNQMKEGINVKETSKTTGTMQVFADLLGDVTNAMTLGEMFQKDEAGLKESTSMAKALAASRSRLPSHTRKALQILATAGSKYYVQVGGKKFETAPGGTVVRNSNPRLAEVPFIISGNTIQIAPPSFKHSPFNDASNMTRLAVAIQLQALTRSDSALDKHTQAIDDLASLVGERDASSPSVARWATQIMYDYVTDPEEAKAFSDGSNEANLARDALSDLATALGLPYYLTPLGANQDIGPEVSIWADAQERRLAEEKEQAEKAATIEKARHANTGPKLGSLAGEADIPVDKFDEIEGADLAETLVMLNDTYGADSEEHVSHLTNLMGIMGQAVNKISLGIAEAVGHVQQGVYDSGRISLALFKQSAAAQTSKLISSGFIQSAAELFAHEVTHAGTVFALDNNAALYNEARSLWEEVSNAVGEDGKPLFDYTLFMPDGVTAESDPETAKFVREEIFNHIFEVRNDPNNGGRSPHVAEFIAYAQTNERFRRAIASFEAKAKQKKEEAAAATNFLGKAQNIFNKVVRFIVQKSDTTDGTLLARLDSLTLRLAANDAKHKGGLMEAADFAAAGAGKVFSATGKAVQKSMGVMGGMISEFPIEAVGNTGKLMVEIANGNLKAIMEGVDAGYDSINKARHGWLSSMIAESIGRRKYEATTRRDIRRITAASDAMRQNIQDSVASAINSAFKKPLAEWGASDQRTLTDVLLRNDISALAYTNSSLTSLDMKKVEDLLANPSMVESQIAALTTQLTGITGVTELDQAFYVRSARALGAFMATGKVVDDLLLNNATAIALKHGTNKSIGATATTVAAHKKQIAMIDQLASLYAMHFTEPSTRMRAAELVKAEPAGTAMLLSSHFATKNDAANTLFKDAPSLMLKGHMPATTAKNIELRLSPTKDESVLAAEGWKPVSKLVKDPADKVTSDMQYYTRKTVGTTYNKGGFDLTSMAARGLSGTKISTMSPSEAKALGVKNAQAIAQRSKSIERMFRPLGAKDSLTDAEIMSGAVPNRMAPTLDSEGKIVEYRYLVPNAINDAVLHRDPNPANVMAIAHGKTKQRAGLIRNTTPLVNTLKIVYDNLSEAKKDTTVEISATSKDERGREIYRMLPAYIKEEIKSVWGRDRMMVPAAMLDPVFGNRSLQIESWLRDPQTAKGLSAITHEVLKGLFGPNVSYKAGYVQATVQDLVAQSKAAQIVKAADVFGLNVLANSVLLIGMGMKPSDVMHYYREAVPETRRYQRDTEEMFAIDMKISAMSAADRFAKGKELYQHKARLTDSLARNPMHELMQAGAYVNIATQMGVTQNEIADNETWMGKIRNARSNYLHETVNKVIDEALLTENSELFKAAVVGAQMTDFAARYALVQHLTRKGANSRRYTKAEAIDVAMDVFVDFAGATSPEMQLANDLGITPFSKYRLRAANALLAAGEINPESVTGLAVLDLAMDATGVMQGVTSFTSDMGMLGLLKSVQTPWEMMSHIADNTLFSYLPSR